MQANPVKAGYQLIDRNNPGVAEALSEDIRLGNAYADALSKCEAESAATGKADRCVVSVAPPKPHRANGVGLTQAGSIS